MLVPLGWLREFTPYEGSAQELGDKLTMRGLELEDILNPFAALDDILVGYVAECAPHPDSDHLHCCKVDLGGGELVDIVCGAPNVAAGQKVAVAPVGSKLPDGTVIKKAKLRGQPSNGMICSERELGLSEDHSGILVLPDTAQPGRKLTDALGLETEVLDISVTPNRADCLSVLGVAREAAQAYNLPLAIPELAASFDGSDTVLPIIIDNPELCWLYAGRVITGARVKQSPLSMRGRLIAAGVRPVSNIVDVTNYILMELGQPLHSFDLDKLKGGMIRVRPAAEGELFTTLDGKERRLAAGDLCVCDAERPVALAGVMGGLNTEIDSASKNVFLESAVFRPQTIRRTSRRLGLGSEASYRFERGVDQRMALKALDRASALIAMLSGGTVGKGLSVSEPRPFIPAKISYQPSRCEKLLGLELTDDYQKEALSSLGCEVESGEIWTVTQPSWRPDLTRGADLVEEVGRVYGLDKIPSSLPPARRSLDDSVSDDKDFTFRQSVKHWAAGLGLNEAINYSFVGQEDLSRLSLPEEKRIAIFNPLSEEQNVLRSCLAPGLLQDLANNLAFGAQTVKLFEIASAFSEDKDEETGAKELPLLGIILSGLSHEQGWPRKPRDFDYSDLKGLLENLFNFLHLDKISWRQDNEHPFLSPCAEVVIGDRPAGYLGRVKPEIAEAYNAKKDVWLSELDLQILRELNARAKRAFKALPVYPPVRRDITVTAGADIKIADILEKLLVLKMPLLEGAALVDCYTPESSSERSLTFRLTFRHPGRTLKDSEVDKEREKAAAFLKKELNVKI